MTHLSAEADVMLQTWLLSVNVTELCVFGIPGSETGKTFALVKTSPGHWEMKGSIELLAEVHGVDCVVKSDEDEDVGYIRFEVSRPARGQRQKVETSEANRNVMGGNRDTIRNGPKSANRHRGRNAPIRTRNCTSLLGVSCLPM
ncbi:hypothetical protein DFP72DRAFT_1045817 [Ephemerocybe angulata]|uniref:Uncharacterized protein n=1 Tax=Ephemerocybe angulata TaxID=980116 RepID=A0A8H6HY25_9AGAR|nr:hypothetical protein DFP72DRAFT_1045817 [Tulosesus angulatus]